MAKIIIRRIILMLFATVLLYGILYLSGLEERLYWENLYFCKIGSSPFFGIYARAVVLLFYDIAVIAAVLGIVYAIKRTKRRKNRMV